MRRLLGAALITFLTAAALTTATAAAADPPVSTFTPRSPVRVLDTRTGTGTNGSTSPVGAGGTVTLDLAAQVPATTTAVVLTVTAVTPTAPSFVTVFPAGATRPTASSLNVVAGDTRANQVTVTLSADRKVSLYNNTGSVHLVADLTGHYATGTGAKFTALPPTRFLDTRTDGGPVGPGGTRVLDLTDRVPASATAVTFNLTATNPTAATFVTAWPTGTARPNASNLNATPGDTRPNLVTVAVGAARSVSLYNNAGAVDLIVDITGFYTPDYGASFLPLAPTRVLDTRNGTGSSPGPVGPAQSIFVDLADRLPPTSTGVVLNITGVDATAATFVTAWAAGGTQPNASTLNLSPGQTVPNAAAVAFRQDRTIQLFNNSGNVHLVADLAGVFAVVEPACTTDCVYAWGGNSDRSLGTAEAVYTSAAPTPVVGLSTVRAVDGGSWQNGYALRGDGTVWAWGNNERGQLGNGWTSTWSGGSGGGSAVPVPVVGLTGVTAIAASDFGAYALRNDGTVWAWGAGTSGRMGNGEFADSSVPVRITALSSVVGIGSGWATGYAVRADGTVWAWGLNNLGALGNGSTDIFSPVPVQVSGLTGVTAVAGRDDGAFALRNDGTVWAWGYNGAGQLGNGQPCDASCVSRVPVQVSGLTGVTAVAGGVNNGYAVRGDGSVWSWGTNYQGALGNGVECDPTAEVCESRVPVRVAGLTGVTQVAAFTNGGYARTSDGSLWSWGTNQASALGNASSPDHASVPVAVVGLPGVSGVAAGWEAGYAIVPNP
jgi:alpha-tubulin suppressor-like RCC1 family protein